MTQYQFEHNHDDTPDPSNRDRLIGWGLIIGVPFLLKYFLR